MRDRDGQVGGGMEGESNERDILVEGAPPTMGWALFCESLIKKIHYGLTHFLSRCSLLSDDTS